MSLATPLQAIPSPCAGARLEVPSSPEPAPMPIVPDAPVTPAVPDPGPSAPDTPTGPDAPLPNDPLPAGPEGPDVPAPDPQGPETA